MSEEQVIKSDSTTTLPIINPRKFYQYERMFIQQNLHARPHIVQAFWGGPGTGKTYCVEESARRFADAPHEYGVELPKEWKTKSLKFSLNPKTLKDPKYVNLVLLHAHQLGPAELKGLSFPNADRTRTVQLPMGILPEEDGGWNFVFIDSDKVLLCITLYRGTCVNNLNNKIIGACCCRRTANFASPWGIA